MGAHASLALITVLVELLCIYKWSEGEFPEPAPLCVLFLLLSLRLAAVEMLHRRIKICWAVFATALVAYPLVHFGERSALLLTAA